MGSFLALFWPRPPSDFLLLISTHYSITPSVNGKLTNTYTFLYGNYFAANVTNTVELKDNFQNYKLLLFVCNNGTAQMYAPTVYPASYIKEIYDSVKNGQYLGKYPSITTFIGSTISGSFIPVADNKFKLTTGMSGTFMILGLK
nr:MAG TPA: hypothetical protein [Caudoviricetes sp.]